MKKAVLLIAVGSLLAVEASLACTPPRYRTPADRLNAMNSPLPLMQVSDNGQYLLKMVPTLWGMKNQDTFFEKRSAYATAFKLKPTGELQQLWSIKDLHPQGKNEAVFSPRYQILMDDEGNTLKVVGSIFRSAKNPEVAWLYKQGKLLKTYHLSYFVKNTSRIMHNSCGTAAWRDDYKTPLNFSSPSLTFKTVDGLSWNINLKTGAVTKSK